MKKCNEYVSILNHFNFEVGQIQRKFSTTCVRIRERVVMEKKV